MAPAIFISACALLFTVGSFWWLHARPGRLVLTEIRIFSGYVRPDRAALRVPVTLYNTGAKPRVVVDLRLHLSSGGLSATAATSVFRSAIRPGPSDVEDFPYPYVVPGRTVVTKFVDFRADPAVMCTGTPADAVLEALVDRRGWREVGSGAIRTDAMADPSVYITYSNDPLHWRPDQHERAAASLAQVRAKLASETAK